jgi:hypothetical protein
MKDKWRCESATIRKMRSGDAYCTAIDTSDTIVGVKLTQNDARYAKPVQQSKPMYTN